MADSEIRTQRKVLHGGIVKFYETSFFHPDLVGHVGEVVGVRSPERGAEAFGDKILVQVGQHQLLARPLHDPRVKGGIERERRRNNAATEATLEVLTESLKSGDALQEFQRKLSERLAARGENRLTFPTDGQQGSL